MKFIDLFAGLGGFHLALKKLGHTCVFASETNVTLRQLYKKNFDIELEGDIRNVTKTCINKIPKHDILCAGFPCQPFSKAGKQAGRKDKTRGTLFDEIVKILEFRKPSYFILENVPFIKKHDNEETWFYMEKELKKLGYSIDHKIYSPHQFGIPQHRQRVFIVGSKRRLKHFIWPQIESKSTTNVKNFILCNTSKTVLLGEEENKCLDIWQGFLDSIPKNIKIPRFPIWAMEFGATYPYEKCFPHRLNSHKLGRYKGILGKSLKGLKKSEQVKLLPSYARDSKKFPDWKQEYIKLNREFYKQNKKDLQDFIDKIITYKSQSWQKLEWNVQNGERNIRKYIIQFRASGIRVKNLDYFPSLVCTSTQIPIIGWQGRYLTKYEAAKLQSMEDLELPANNHASFYALGNAVNVKIVHLIASSLIKNKSKTKKQVYSTLKAS